MSQPETTQDAELLLRFTRAGHEAGYGTADLEEWVLALAQPLGARLHRPRRPHARARKRRLQQRPAALIDRTITGITAGFDTFVTAISIAYRLMLSTVVLPRCFTQMV